MYLNATQTTSVTIRRAACYDKFSTRICIVLFRRSASTAQGSTSVGVRHFFGPKSITAQQNMRHHAFDVTTTEFSLVPPQPVVYTAQIWRCRQSRGMVPRCRARGAPVPHLVLHCVIAQEILNPRCVLWLGRSARPDRYKLWTWFRCMTRGMTVFPTLGQ